MKKIIFALVVSTLLLIAACSSNSDNSSGLKTIKSAPVGNLTVTLANDAGQLKHGAEEFMLSFTDASGKPVEVGAAALTFRMQSMGTMPVMNDAAAFTTTNTPGVYRGKAKIEMAGEWQAQVSYEGAAGRGQTSFPVNVK